MEVKGGGVEVVSAAEYQSTLQSPDIALHQLIATGHLVHDCRASPPTMASEALGRKKVLVVMVGCKGTPG